MPLLSSFSRLFIAMPPCHALCEALPLLRERNRELKGVRWIPAANLHVTVLFLGDTDNGKIPEIADAMRQVNRSTEPFELRLEKISTEGGRPMHPSMVWARFHRSAAFTELSARLRDSLDPFLKITPRFHDPVPHVTLARIRSGTPPDLDVAVDCRITYRGMQLWRTIRQPGQVVYEPVVQVSFPPGSPDEPRVAGND